MMCYIWLYTSIIVVRGLFDVLSYLLEKRMKKMSNLDISLRTSVRDEEEYNNYIYTR